LHIFDLGMAGHYLFAFFVMLTPEGKQIFGNLLEKFSPQYCRSRLKNFFFKESTKKSIIGPDWKELEVVGTRILLEMVNKCMIDSSFLTINHIKMQQVKRLIHEEEGFEATEITDQNWLDYYFSAIWKDFQSLYHELNTKRTGTAQTEKELQIMRRLMELTPFIPCFSRYPKFHGMEELIDEKKRNGPCMTFESSVHESKHHIYRAGIDCSNNKNPEYFITMQTWNQDFITFMQHSTIMLDGKTFGKELQHFMRTFVPTHMESWFTKMELPKEPKKYNPNWIKQKVIPSCDFPLHDPQWRSTVNLDFQGNLGHLSQFEFACFGSLDIPHVGKACVGNIVQAKDEYFQIEAICVWQLPNKSECLIVGALQELLHNYICYYSEIRPAPNPEGLNELQSKCVIAPGEITQIYSTFPTSIKTTILVPKNTNKN
jgi:hypothetical protein